MPGPIYRQQVEVLQASIIDLLSQNERASLKTDALDGHRERFIDALKLVTEDDMLSEMQDYEAAILSGRGSGGNALKQCLLDASKDPEKKAAVEGAVQAIEAYRKAILKFGRLQKQRTDDVMTLNRMNAQLTHSLSNNKSIHDSLLFIMEQEIAGCKRFFKQHMNVLALDEVELQAHTRIYQDMADEIEQLIVPRTELRIDFNARDELTKAYRVFQKASKQVKSVYARQKENVLAAERLNDLDARVAAYQDINQAIASDYNIYSRAKAEYQEVIDVRKVAFVPRLDACLNVIFELEKMAGLYHEGVMAEHKITELNQSLEALRTQAAAADGRSGIEASEKAIGRFETMLRGESEALRQQIIEKKRADFIQKKNSYLEQIGSDARTVRFRKQLDSIKIPSPLRELSLTEVVQTLEQVDSQWQAIVKDCVFAVDKAEKEEAETASLSSYEEGTTDSEGSMSDVDLRVSAHPHAALLEKIMDCNHSDEHASYLTALDIETLVSQHDIRKAVEQLFDEARTNTELRSHLPGAFKLLLSHPGSSLAFKEELIGQIFESPLSRDVDERAKWHASFESVFGSSEKYQALQNLFDATLALKDTHYSTALNTGMREAFRILATHENVATLVNSVVSHQDDLSSVQKNDLWPMLLSVLAMEPYEDSALIDKRIKLHELLTDETEGAVYQNIIMALYVATNPFAADSTVPGISIGMGRASVLLPGFLKGMQGQGEAWVTSLEAYPKDKLDTLATLMTGVNKAFEDAIWANTGDQKAQQLLRITRNKALGALINHPNLQHAADATANIINRDLKMKPTLKASTFNSTANVFKAEGIPLGFYEKFKKTKIFSTERSKGSEAPMTLKERLGIVRQQDQDSPESQESSRFRHFFSKK
ncbi:MAG: hypothetical protein K0U37_01130 [Gammaproteobacteria bacterium]|nr:hypothetical protein [Gammaproteobacteria bacterium]